MGRRRRACKIKSPQCESPSQGRGSNSKVTQYQIPSLPSGVICDLTTIGRAKFIFHSIKYYTKLPNNSILGVMANLYRETDGKIYPYEKWGIDVIADCHGRPVGPKFACGGLRANNTDAINNLIDSYNTGDMVTIKRRILDKADKYAKRYNGSANTPTAHHAINVYMGVREDFVEVSTFEQQVEHLCNKLKKMKKLYSEKLTPADASALFHHANNPSLKRKDKRWKHHGDEILRQLRSGGGYHR